MFKSLLEKSRALPWKVGNQILSCAPTPLIMGIVNVTPDSFFDGGQHNTLDAAYVHSQKLLSEGAVILDIGGESSRPGSTPVSVQEELDRVCPLVERLTKLSEEISGKDAAPTFYISVDTVKSKVAEESMRLGAHIINDISACSMDPEMPAVVGRTGASVVLNHMRGSFGKMQQDFKPYENVVQEVRDELLNQVCVLLAQGVDPQKICLDPGIGFGKTVQDNIDLMKSVEDMLDDGYPILIGTSRKSYIGKMAGLESSDRLIPTVTAGIVAALGGASIIRVHDVKEAKESMLYLEAMNGSV